MDNTPQTPPQVPTPTPTPELTPTPPPIQFGSNLPPEEPQIPQSNKKKYILIGTIAAAAVLLLVAAVFMFTRGGDNFISRMVTPAHKDWLKPTDEIKIGATRYVSSCQALRLEDIKSLVGAPGSDANISEFYYDQSPDASVRSISNSCEYTLKQTEINSIELKVDQFGDTSNIKSDSSSILPSSSAIKSGLSGYETVTKSTSDNAVKAFVKKMSDSSQMVAKYEGVYDENKLKEYTLDGLIVPTDDSIYFVVGNDIYTLKYSYNGTKSNEGYVARIKQIKETIDAIKKNIADKSLSQSPAPTVLNGSDTYGDARVLESCAVFSPQVFTAATGLKQDDQVFRFGYVYDIAKDRVAPGDKSTTLPHSQCTREYTPYNDPATEDTAASVSMDYTLSLARSSDVAQKWIQAYHAKAPGDTTLKTNADWAQQSALEDLLDSGDKPQLYMFRVGPYIGEVSILKTQSDGISSDIKQTTATPDEHVKAINALVDSLKANIKAAQSSR